MKVVINSFYGGFELSKEAREELGILHDYQIKRTDKKLIGLMEKKGAEFCSGPFASLKILDIPDPDGNIEIISNKGNEIVKCCVNGKEKWFRFMSDRGTVETNANGDIPFVFTDLQ